MAFQLHKLILESFFSKVQGLKAADDCLFVLGECVPCRVKKPWHSQVEGGKALLYQARLFRRRETPQLLRALMVCLLRVESFGSIFLLNHSNK